jgi:multidrug efflux pump
MVVFLLPLLSLAGVLGYTQLGQKEDPEFTELGQKEDPEFTVKVMLVQAAWPGSSAQHMSEQVTDKLEKKLQEVAEIDTMASYAKPGLTQITITSREDTPPSAVPQVWHQVRKKLGDIAHTLPQGVRGPFFNDEFGDTFGNLHAITGAGFSYPELKDAADAARNEFLRLTDSQQGEAHRRAGREGLYRGRRRQAGVAGHRPGADLVHAGRHQHGAGRRHGGACAGQPAAGRGSACR